VTLNPRILLRKIHRWGAVLIALPFLIVLGTGLLLQLKKEIPWVQPPSARGQTKYPIVSFDTLLAAAKDVPDAEVQSWDDIDRLDVRPDRGIVKVQCKNRWEIQIDTATGSVLQVAYRRSDVIESIHDGSWFHDNVKYWIFVPTAVVVVGLWFTGMYLFVLPHWVKWRRARKEASAKGLSQFT
jgi:uncharacterized iron-regulated membrane protein